MKTGFLVAVLMFVLAAPCHAQNTSTGNATTTGPCSPAVSAPGNSFTINCGIDKAQGQKMLAILNKILASQLDPDAVMRKLDEIQKALTPAQPDVFLRFVYPTSPALVIVNPSDALAKDMKYAVELWNMDVPDRDDPLPIPTSTFDWLKGHSEGGPQNLFDAPTVSSLLKPGDHLFGSATVNCPTCVRGKTYVVYIEWGKGGWVTEVVDGNGQLLIPKNFKRDFRMQYFQQLPQMIPADKKVPIGEWPTDADRNP